MLRFTKTALAALVFSLFVPIGAEAADAGSAKLVDAKVIDNLKQAMGQYVVGLSVKAQNKNYGDLTQEQIDGLDKQWRAEANKEDQPLIAGKLASPLSIYLTSLQAHSQGLYSEIFVMDKNGLNVGQGSITSDYWQGDEAKFQKTFDVGPNAVFIDEPEFNDDFKVWRVQVNFTLVNGGEKVGAVTVEINLDELERRSTTAQ